MNEIFFHELTKTDVHHRLAVTSKALPHLPRFEGDLRAQHLTVEDEEGTEWVFRYKIRKGRHKKPELSIGWLNFIRSKKLKIGDKIHFFKKEDKATGVPRYKIKVMKKFTLLGFVSYVPYDYQAYR